MQLNSHEKQNKIFIFSNLENVMSAWIPYIYSKWQLVACCCSKSVCLDKISDVAWEKMHFTWFSRRDRFSPTRHQILPSPLYTRLWAGYGELVGENSISPGKPCEMHISYRNMSPDQRCHVRSLRKN